MTITLKLNQMTSTVSKFTNKNLQRVQLFCPIQPKYPLDDPVLTR